MTNFTIRPEANAYNIATGKHEPTYRGEIDEGALTVTSADKGRLGGGGGGGALEGEGVAAVLFFFILIGIVVVAIYFIGKGTYLLVKKIMAHQEAEAHAKRKAAQVAHATIPAAPVKSEAELRAEAEAEWDKRLRNQRANRLMHKANTL